MSVRTMTKDEIDAQTPILYFGKADALRKRIKDLVRFAAGEPVAHWGGRYLWQISGSSSFARRS